MSPGDILYLLWDILSAILNVMCDAAINTFFILLVLFMLYNGNAMVKH